MDTPAATTDATAIPAIDQVSAMSDLVLVREAHLEDAQELLNIYAYYVENTAISFEYTVPTLEEFQNRMKRIQTKYPYLVAKRDGKILGYAYAGPFVGRAAYDWACELTIYLDPSERHRYVGKRLYLALFGELKRMGITNLYACIGYPRIDDEYLTKNSAHFHEHMGFTLAGTFQRSGYKFNRWYDMIWMEKIIGEHCSDQPAVTPYPYVIK